jgi:hypothetical protein
MAWGSPRRRARADPTCHYGSIEIGTAIWLEISV